MLEATVVGWLPFMATGWVLDIHRKKTVIAYDLEPEIEEAWTQLVETFEDASRCQQIMNIQAEGAVAGVQKKYHAGATRLLDTRDIKISLRKPATVETNVNPICLPTGKETIFFFPDRLLIQSSQGFGILR